MGKLKLSSFAVRQNAEGIEELAQSIREKGLLEPILVRPADDEFEIIAGWRRYNACKLLRWRKILCHVVELDDRSALEASLVENVQRRSMRPIEEAEAYHRYVHEYGWGSLSELARKLGKSASYLSRRISILELPKDVLECVRKSEINPSVAEELSRLVDKGQQTELAKIISHRHLSLRKTRSLINELAGGDEPAIASVSASGLRENERAYNQTIVAMRLALSRLGSIMESVEGNWVDYEILMANRNVVHQQIDVLLKAKKNLERDRPSMPFA